jgi:FecR protein
MNNPVPKTFGERVAAAQDEAVLNDSLARAEGLLFEQDSSPQAQRPRPRVLQWALAMAALGLVTFGVLNVTNREDVVSVSTNEVSTPVGGWIVAGEHESQVSFSDGTSMVLPAASAMRLLGTTANGAQVALERGTVKAQVKHRATTSYSVQAGPYTVDVIGTRFEVKWEPAAGVFSVSVFEGLVRVKCAETGLAPTEVKGGEQLTSHRSAQGWSAELSRTAGEIEANKQSKGAAEVPLQMTESPTAGEDEAVPPLKMTSKKRGPVVAEPRAEKPDWVHLADSGDAPGALKAVRALGLTRVLQMATSAELLTLASAARSANDVLTSTKALEKCRQRFPSSRASALAAFEFARFARERGDRSAADLWLHRYLQESPKGPLAREAHGRLLEDAAEVDVTSARELARKYLGLYPEGPHSALAKSLLNP